MCWQWAGTLPSGLPGFDLETEDSQFEGIFPVDMYTPGFIRITEKT